MIMLLTLTKYQKKQIYLNKINNIFPYKNKIKKNQ